MSEADDVRRLQEVQRKLRAGEVEVGVRRLLAHLDSARRALVAEVADSDWDRYLLPRLTAAVDRQLAHWQDLALQDLGGAQAHLWTMGGTATLAVVGVMGATVSLPELPTSLLQALQRQSGQLVRGLTRSARARLDRVLTQALLTGQPREAAIASIGRVLETGSLGRPQGVFGSVGARAAFIYHHETGQAYAVAQDLRREQVTRYVPELRKVWVHDGHPMQARPDHVAMHGQRRAQDEAFVNPVTGARLRFPRDPAADISETAGCTCDVVLWREAYGSVQDVIGEATGSAAEAA